MWAVADSVDPALTATLYSDVIRFEADGVASLRLTIYDLAENELWSSGLILGSYVDWDRTNARGERLANDYYLHLAQGWDSLDSVVLDKAGRVVLLPGDQVELNAAPTASPSSDDCAWRTDDPIFAPKVYDATNWYVSGDLGAGTDTPSRPLHVLDGSMLLQHTSDTIRQYFYSPARRWMLFASGLDGAFGIYDLDAGARRHAIATSGNFGIGVDAPTKRLNVSGDINMAGFLYRNGTTLVHNHATNCNTFVGRSAGNLTMSGGENTGMGDSALNGLTLGNSNMAFGENALFLTTTGHSNAAIGDDALFSNVGGEFNTGVGDNTS